MTPQREVDLIVEHTIRDCRQSLMLENARIRARLMIGMDTLSPRARTFFLLRASIALARVIGLSPDQITHVNRHVFSKPLGDAFQEVGGTAVTLMALCESIHISLWNAEFTEAERCTPADKLGNRDSTHAMMERTIRDNRQFRVLEWARRVFGVPDRADTASPQERSLRFIEEVIELAQAIGLNEASVEESIRHFSRDQPDEPFREAGRAAVALMSLCESLEISFWEAEVTEFDRVLSKTPEHFQARQADKRAAGLEYVP